MGQPRFGGIGGNGGNVVLIANEETTLNQVLKKNPTKLVKASVGQNSQVHRLVGESGADCCIKVPTGLSVFTLTGAKLGELNVNDDKLTVAKGGLGGQPVTQFNGLKGEELKIVLDLKLIADVGLVGFPNAGKSSLLKAISRAKPRVAAYPFTTLKPQIGTIQFDDLRQITMADLPGLIEGAHRNSGLGYRFLKHIERTKLLLLVVDINGFCLGMEYPHRTPLETLALLNRELELYGHGVLSKPAVLLVNKMDTPAADEQWKTLQPALLRFEESIRSLPEWMQPEQILKFDHVVNMSVEKDTAAVRHLATKIRDLLDLHADLQQSELGKSSLMALEPMCQLDREKHIQRSNSEHQSQILI